MRIRGREVSDSVRAAAKVGHEHIGREVFLPFRLFDDLLEQALPKRDLRGTQALGSQHHPPRVHHDVITLFLGGRCARHGARDPALRRPCESPDLASIDVGTHRTQREHPYVDVSAEQRGDVFRALELQRLQLANVRIAHLGRAHRLDERHRVEVSRIGADGDRQTPRVLQQALDAIASGVERRIRLDMKAEDSLNRFTSGVTSAAPVLELPVMWLETNVGKIKRARCGLPDY